MENNTHIPKGSETKSSNSLTPQKLFEQFLQKNEKLIWTILKPYCGLDEYDDLLQEAYIGIFKAIITYDPSYGSKLTTYAYACARNEIRMYLRRNNAKGRSETATSIEIWERNNENSLLDYTLWMRGESNDGQNMDEKVYMHIAFQVAMDIIEKEMSQEIKIVLMHFLAGVPQSQTARDLKISQSSVSKMCKHTLAILKEKMRDFGFTETV